MYERRRVISLAFWSVCLNLFSPYLYSGIFSPLDETELIAHIAIANTNNESDVIDLANGPFILSSTVDTTDGNNGLPSILSDGFPITIQNGTISRGAGDSFRFFRIAPGAELNLDNVVLQNGLANVSGFGQAGGAILNLGILSIQDSVLHQNTGDFGGALYTGNSAITTILSTTFSLNVANNNGGAIYNDDLGTIIVDSSMFESNSAAQNGGAIFNDGDGGGATIPRVQNVSFSQNSAGQNGGAIYNDFFITTISSSTFSNNTSGNSGGAIHNDNASTISEIRNSTVSGNIAANGSGGGINNITGGVIEKIGNSTITLNVAQTFGGGIESAGVIVDFVSNIVAENTASVSGHDLSLIADPSTATFNLIGTDSDHSIGDGFDGNKVGTDGIPLNPMLEPLANNGGATLTHALNNASPAIDMGDNPDALVFDQRGAGFPRTVGTQTDIGAYELFQEENNFSPDHYLSYQIKTTPFYAKTISLKDQFMEWTDFFVTHPFKLLNPARKKHNGQMHEIKNEELHYTAFKLGCEQDISISRNVQVTNQFGEFVINEFRPNHLLVPSNKVDFLPACRQGCSPVYENDYYLCYDFPSQEIERQQGKVYDQFRSRHFSTVTATRLCNPVASIYEGRESKIVNNAATNHLMCFQIRKQRISRSVALLNQFGIQHAVTINDDEICVPSVKIEL